MKKDIDLGSFDPGQGRNLVVKLSLNEGMDNEYEDLLGKVKWVFSARGKDPAPDADPDASGDGNSSGNTGGNNGGNSITGNAGELYATASASPKTGDETRILAKCFLLILAFLAILITGRRLSRKERNI